MFKNPLSEFLKKIRKIGFAGGSLDAEADEASSRVDEIRSVTPPVGERTVAGRDDEKEEAVAAAEQEKQRPA